MMESAPVQLQKAVDVCINQGIIDESENLKWRYTRCKTGSFSSVYKIHVFYLENGENEEDGANELRRKETKVKTVACKYRLSSVRESNGIQSVKDGTNSGHYLLFPRLLNKFLFIFSNI